MQCNIDAKGRAVRLISGIATTIASVALIVVALMQVLPWSQWVWVALGAVMLVIGVFQIYEGWAGWCVVRAMGFKTKI